MTSAETKQRVASGGMFLLPVLLVLGTAKFISPPTVTMVSAATGAVDPFLVGTNAGPVASAEQIRAQAHIRMLREQDFGPTPLYYRPRAAQVDPTDDGPQRPEGVPAFKVQAIMASPSGDSVLIDGGLHRVGDALGQTGWTIDAVSVAERSVEIRQESTGRRAVLRVESNPLRGADWRTPRSR